MESIYKDLRQSGYLLTRDIFQEYVDEGCKTKNDFIKFFLDDDMRQICDESLPKEIEKYTGTLEGKYILQIVSIRNIAASTVNQNSNISPRMLQIKLTDGKSKCTGFEFGSLSFLSLSTYPGTKLEICNCRMKNGRMLLTKENCKLLGGYVESIVEIWKHNEEVKRQSLQRSFLKIKVDNQDRPPAFISFDEYIKQKNYRRVPKGNELSNDPNYKALMNLSNTELIQEQTKDPMVLSEEMKQKREQILNQNESTTQTVRWGSTLSTEKVMNDLSHRNTRGQKGRKNKSTTTVIDQTQSVLPTSNKPIQPIIPVSSGSFKVLNYGTIDTGFENVKEKKQEIGSVVMNNQNSNQRRDQGNREPRNQRRDQTESKSKNNFNRTSKDNREGRLNFSNKPQYSGYRGERNNQDPRNYMNNQVHSTGNREFRNNTNVYNKQTQNNYQERKNNQTNKPLPVVVNVIISPNTLSN